LPLTLGRLMLTWLAEFERALASESSASAFGVVVVILADAGNAIDFGLVVQATDRCRSMLAGIADQELGALLHLGFGGARTLA
jgi:hypothetical protein